MADTQAASEAVAAPPAEAPGAAVEQQPAAQDGVPAAAGDGAEATQGVKREREEEDVSAVESKRAAAGDAAPQSAAPGAVGDVTVTTPQEAQAAAAAAAAPDGAAPATMAPVAGATGTDKTEETYPVPDDIVGRIIGKGGATIRSIENISGAHIDIPPECAPGTTDRMITITGTAAQIAYCKAIVQQKVDGGGESTIPLPAEGQGDPTNPVSTKIVQCPNDHVGRIIGKGGATIRQMQELSGAHIDVAKECKPGTDYREVTLTGNPQQMQYCEQLIQQKLAGEALPTASSVYGYPAPNETKCYIPNDMVGRIIGKGGETIRQLQDQSGVHMDIAKDCAPGTNQREVTIRGEPYQTQYCMQLLNQKIAGQAGDYGGQGVVTPAYPGMGAQGAQGAQGGYGGYGAAAAGQYGAYGQAYAQQYQQYQQYYAQQAAAQQQQQQQGGAAATTAAGAGAAAYGQQAYGQQQQYQQPTQQQQQQYQQYYAQQAAAQQGQGQAAAYGQQAAAAYGQQPTAAGGNSQTLTVPNDLVGRIIGKAGATVKEIQDQSGAHVDIPRDVGQPMREITITGDPTQIAICNTLIQQKMASRY